MEKKVTDAHVIKIAKFLPKWKAVSKLLEVESEIVKDVEDRYGNGEERRTEALMKWVGKEGPRATYRKLYCVLIEGSATTEISYALLRNQSEILKSISNLEIRQKSPKPMKSCLKSRNPVEINMRNLCKSLYITKSYYVA